MSTRADTPPADLIDSRLTRAAKRLQLHHRAGALDDMRAALWQLQATGEQEAVEALMVVIEREQLLLEQEARTSVQGQT
jgi:hypothetical protein